MSKKFFIGLAAVGGGLWYYDQNVLPIFTRDSKGRPVGVRGKPNEDLRKEFSKLDDKGREFGSQLKKTVNELVGDIRQKTDETVSQIKDLELYNKWSQKLDDYLKDVRVATEDVDAKPLGHRWAAKYIDFVNGLGQTKDDKLRELASATSSRQQQIKKDLARSEQSWSSWWSGKKSEAEDTKNEFKSKAEREKQSWFSWGRAKKEEGKQELEDGKQRLEKEKNLWGSWANKKSDEAERSARDAKNDLKALKDSWTNWGSAKADEAERNARSARNDVRGNYEQLKAELGDNYEAGKQRALEEYYRAKKNVEDLTQLAKDKAGRLLNKEPTDDRHLRKAESDFLSAMTNLKKYGYDLVDSVKGN